jgi:nitrite reductase/ring-hydroxylating ferredoxin subunit
MPKHVVARADDIVPGSRKCVTAGGRAIVVFNLKGEYFALSSTCPHRGADLSGGKLTGLVQSDGPGDYRYERQGEIIRCPWHAWEFDIRTGRSYCDPTRMRLMQFDAKVEPGAELVAKVGEGPYTAETFAVSVEADYLVIEVP